MSKGGFACAAQAIALRVAQSPSIKKAEYLPSIFFIRYSIFDILFRIYFIDQTGSIRLPKALLEPQT